MNNCYYIIRHGESVLNEQGRHQGWIARNPLTEKGRIQAREAAEKLKNKEINFIFASPLLRTKQTAKIIAQKLNLPVNFSERLKENNQSKSWEGLLANEYKQLPSYLSWKQKIAIVVHNGNIYYLVRYWARVELTLEEVKNAVVYKVTPAQKQVEPI